MNGSREVNPFAPDPDTCSSGELVSGGAGDGQVHHIVTALVQLVNPRPAGTVALDVFRPDLREFDLAELLTWAGDTAGLERRLPASTADLRARCYQQRTMLRSVADGTNLKGALLFGSGQLGVALGIRGRVVVSDLRYGVVVAGSDVWTWTEAARIPGARGYR